jgi:hypothetical protein
MDKSIKAGWMLLPALVAVVARRRNVFKLKTKLLWYAVIPFSNAKTVCRLAWPPALSAIECQLFPVTEMLDSFSQKVFSHKKYVCTVFNVPDGVIVKSLPVMEIVDELMLTGYFHVLNCDVR